MFKSIYKKFLSVVLSITMFSGAGFVTDIENKTSLETNAAVSQDYSPQLMNLALYDDSKNLTVSATADKTSASLAAESGKLNEQWRIDYCGANSTGSYYKIVNAASGRLLTPYEYSTASGSEIVIYGNENNHTQYWYIIPVSQDTYGNDLYYKIVNYSDSSMALTAGSSGTTLSSYSGANSQKWLLNAAGLQGFAGYAKDMNGNVKASAIGGLLGETVEVTTFDELKAACTSTETKTIIITADISGKTGTGNYSISTGYDGGQRYYCSDNYIYLQPNKTIIGSYNAHTLHNVYFRTYNENYGPAYDFIIRNITCTHDTELNTDNVWEFAYGWNIWIDHCDFEGHSATGTSSLGSDDWDKFLNVKGTADYITISDCTFGHHVYGVLLGYPTDTQDTYNTYNGQPCVTLSGNYYNNCITRAPALMRYGYFHSMNNYVVNFDMGYTIYTACKLFAENCYYDGGTGKGSVVNDSTSTSDISSTYPGVYTDSGSVAVNCYNSNNLANVNSQACSWRPSQNYTYTSKSASAAMSYCTTYSGAQSSKNTVNYIGYASAGVPSATYMAAPSDEWGSTPVVMAIDTYYMIKNANSGLYLDVAGAAAENGTNVQQWGATEAGIQNTWRFVYAEEGYYYIQSMVGDKTYVMDVTAGSTANGTNIEIYSYKANDNQKFMITANSDGTYKIVPKVSGGSSFVEIADASAAAGGNCQIWENTGSACQNWIFEEVEYSGETMDTSVNYMFKNANSGLYMEVADANDADGANIQQWGSSGSTNWNSWTLKVATDDLYYIVSKLSGGRYITINSENAELAARDSSSNVQMMRFVKNPDGTYLIVTRTAYNKTTCRYTKALEVADASASAGANVQQAVINGAASQSWTVETFTVTTTTTTTTAKATTTTTTTTTTAKATTTTTTTAAPITYDAVVTNVSGAESVDIIFSGSSYAGINGVVGYWDNAASEWVEVSYEDTLDGDGKYTLNIVLPAEAAVTEIQILIYWSGVWDSSISETVDTAAKVESVTLNMPAVTTTTTTTTAKTTTTTTTTTTAKTTTTTAKTTTTTTTTSTTVKTTTTSTTTTAKTTTTTTTSAVVITTTTTVPLDVVYGDADCDGEVSIADVVKIMTHLTTPGGTLTDEGINNADVYQRGDGVGNMDALAIQKSIAQLIQSLPESYL